MSFTSSVSATAKARIEMQGFTGLDTETLAGINLGLRTAPAVCMVWAGVGTALASAPALWSLAPFALLGAILPGHPFDVLYRFGLRRLMGGKPLPTYPLPRRFACLLATVMLSIAAWGFQSGHMAVGYGVGAALAAAASVNVFTGFCIPSFFYGLLFGKPSGC
jgi:hypothetical protein